jgi:hypothetical protein
LICQLHLLRLSPFPCSGPRQLALENLALRQQLAVYKRTVTRPNLRATDRLFWVGLARVWAGWRRSLVIVTPDIVLSVAAAPVPGALDQALRPADRVSPLSEVSRTALNQIDCHWENVGNSLGGLMTAALESRFLFERERLWQAGS